MSSAAVVIGDLRVKEAFWDEDIFFNVYVMHRFKLTSTSA